jgi:MgtE intracellular N domain
VTQADEVLARIVAAPAADAAALVLDMPRPQTRAVLAALGPRETARLLRGVRADRVAELVNHIAPGALPGVLAQLSVSDIAELVPWVPVEMAVHLVTHLPPETVADLLLALPTQQRTVLQRLLPAAAAAGPTGRYQSEAEQALRRATGGVAQRDQRGALRTEVFGRPIQVIVRDRPGAAFGPPDLHAAIGATDWRNSAGLLVLTNATLEPALGAELREARQHGYVVEALQWQDERDDGALKRILVRLAA